MLSRKHYKAIAKIIKDNTSQTEDNNTLVIDREFLIDDLCYLFAKDNNLFNSALFRDACRGDE